MPLHGQEGAPPGPRRDRLLTRAQVRSAEIPGVRVDYMDVVWNEMAFEALESGGALPLVNRDWLLAQLAITRPIRMDETLVPEGTYALVVHPNRDGKGTALEIRRVADPAELQRGRLLIAPEGTAVYRERVTWSRVGETSPRAQIAIVPVAGGGQFVVSYGDRRLEKAFAFAAVP